MFASWLRRVAGLVVPLFLPFSAGSGCGGGSEPLGGDVGLFDPLNNISYTGDSGCGIGSFTIDTSQGLIQIPTFGINDNVTFTLESGSEDTASANGLTIFDVGGHTCTIMIEANDTITTDCVKGASSCMETFTPASGE